MTFTFYMLYLYVLWWKVQILQTHFLILILKNCIGKKLEIVVEKWPMEGTPKIYVSKKVASNWIWCPVWDAATYRCWVRRKRQFTCSGLKATLSLHTVDPQNSGVIKFNWTTQEGFKTKNDSTFNGLSQLRRLC